MPERTCQRPGCGRAIPSRKRQDARWCSRSCESKARRAARRKADFEAANPDTAELLRAEDQSLADLYGNAGPPRDWRDDPRNFSDYGDVPGDVELAAEIDDDDDQEWATQDKRIRTLLEEDQDQRTPREAWKRWRAYGRRHGTEDPEQTQDRIARHQAAEAARTARIDRSTAGRVQSRFDTRTAANVANNALQSRALNRRYVERPPIVSPGFDFTGESFDGGPYRSGRPSGQRSGHADYQWDLGTTGFIY